MMLTTIPSIRLQYDDALGLVRASWVGDSQLLRFRPAIMQLTRLASNLGVRHCLLEMDTVPDISIFDQLWMSQHWLPHLIRLATMQRVVFTIQPQRIYQQVVIDSLLKLAQPFIRFDVQFFQHPEAAMHWLTDNSPRLPDLLAEWEAPSAPPFPTSTAESKPSHGLFV